MLRDDIGEILDYAARQGTSVYLSSNGVPVREKADCIGPVRRMVLSLDGPPEIHAKSRGEGTFEKVMEAVEVCRNKSISVIFLCVLSRWNLDAVEDLLRIARDLWVEVMFQPATVTQIYSNAANPIAPSAAAYREAVRRLIERKRAGAPIANSVAGLRHLAKWPDDAALWCPAGRIACGVEPDGTFVACDRVQRDFLNRRTGIGLSEALPPPASGCSQCWCAPLVELALAFSLRPSAMVNAWRFVSRCE